jgi:integrase
MANPARLFFVTRDMAEKVLAECPTNEWRLIFALCRFGGLRCPSELLALTWGDVDWAKGRFLIRSPKLEHTARKGKRFVPLFPELRPYLEQAFEDCPEGEVYVIRKTRDTNANLRTRLTKYIERAGLTPWPRLFQNLRASRETELAGQFPLHVVTEWLGNSNLIATKHYLSVTDADFDKAVRGGAESGAVRRRQGRAEDHPITRTGYPGGRRTG